MILGGTIGAVLSLGWPSALLFVPLGAIFRMSLESETPPMSTSASVAISSYSNRIVVSWRMNKPMTRLSRYWSTKTGENKARGECCTRMCKLLNSSSLISGFSGILSHVCSACGVRN